MSDIPPKLYFRIGEVAGLVGVEPHVLRYWEREFRSIRPSKSAKGQRVYSRKDVENLLRVRDLLYRDGFTIAGAKKKLVGTREDENAAPASAETPRRAADDRSGPAFREPPEGPRGPEQDEDSNRISTSRARVRDKLLALRDEVESFLQELSPASAPDRSGRSGH